MTELHLTERAPIAAARDAAGANALNSTTIAAVLRERLEQVEKHGYGPDHDALHDGAEIGQGALAYLCAGLAIELGDAFDPDAASAAACLDRATDIWPWQRELFRPRDYYTCLVKAAAMLIAEADRVMLAGALIEHVGRTDTSSGETA